MSDKSEKMTENQIAQWQKELYELEPNCSTGKPRTPQEQKQKIDAQRKLVGG